MPSANTRMPAGGVADRTRLRQAGHGQRLIPRHLDPALARQLTRVCWHGAANRLSRDEPVPGRSSTRLSVATRNPGARASHGVRHTRDAGDRERRRAQAPTDLRPGRSSCSGEACWRATAGLRSRPSASTGCSSRVMPRGDLPPPRRPMPWDSIAWDPAVHLGMFVHRVDGLAPGLYMLVRDPAKLDRLKRAMRARFDWSTPPGCPPELPLRLLEAGDVQTARDAARLPPGHRRRRRLLARHGRRVPGCAVHAWRLVLSAAVLGSGADRAGALPGSRGSGRPRQRASAASSTTRCTGCSARGPVRSSRCITSRSAARSTTPA